MQGWLRATLSSVLISRVDLTDAGVGVPLLTLRDARGSLLVLRSLVVRRNLEVLLKQPGRQLKGWGMGLIASGTRCKLSRLRKLKGIAGLVWLVQLRTQSGQLRRLSSASRE